MAAPGVTMVFKFKYRGNDEEWSQQYHFVGDPPSDDTAWDALIDDLALILRDATTTRVTQVRAYGYDDTDHDAVHVRDFAVVGPQYVGTIDATTQDVAPGDAAAWIRWKTGLLNSKGKPIYLRKYFHSVVLVGPTDDDQDSIAPTYTSALVNAGETLMGTAGDWPGIADPSGRAPDGPVAGSIFVTTRTLKRRGARP